MNRYTPYILAFILFAMIAFFGLRQKEESLPSYKPTGLETLPNFTFKTLDGRTIKLSDFKGKVVLLNFWATWCPPCKEEMPIFEKEYKKCKDAGLEVLAVNMDTSQSSLEKFLKENTYSFKIVKPTQEVEKELKLMGFPTSYLLDKEGKIYRIKLGVYRELEKDLRELLGC